MARRSVAYHRRVSGLVATRFARNVLARASWNSFALWRVWPGRTDQLLISPQGQVVLNVAGANSKAPIDFSGGSVAVPSGIPGNFIINYGGTDKLQLDGQADLYGVLYAPKAAVKMSGKSDWFGAIVVSTLDNSGGAAIHFDRRLGP